MGWAFGRIGEIPRCGVVELGKPASDPDEQGWQLFLWMRKFTAENGVDILYTEAPLLPRATGVQTSSQTVGNLIGLHRMARSIGRGAGILRRHDANVQSVRKVFVGEARPADPKAIVQSRCRALGWKAPDDNAADAAAVWAFGSLAQRPGVPLAQGDPIVVIPPRRRYDAIPDISA